jgi:hypothetical protein
MDIGVLPKRNPSRYISMRPQSAGEIMKTVPGMEEEMNIVEERENGCVGITSLSIKYSIQRLGVLTGTFQEL